MNIAIIPAFCVVKARVFVNNINECDSKIIIVYTIVAARSFDIFEHVVGFMDDDEGGAIARKWNAEINFSCA